MDDVHEIRDRIEALELRLAALARPSTPPPEGPGGSAVSRRIDQLARRVGEQERRAMEQSIEILGLKETISLMCQVLRELDDPYGLGERLDDRIGLGEPTTGCDDEADG